MAQLTVVLEGSLQYREGKKWKPRWCVVRKLSPAADLLHIALYKNARDRFRNGQEKACIPLEDFYGIKSPLCVGGEQYVMAIICQKDTILLAFQNKETLCTWQIAVRSHLGEETQFCGLQLIKAPARSKLPVGTVTLLLQGNKVGLTTNVTPPKILANWRLSDIRKFGVIDEDKFCIQAAGKNSKLSGVFAFESEEASSITSALQKATKHSPRYGGGGGGRSHNNSESESRQSSQSSLISGKSTLQDLQSGSLPRDFRRRDFHNAQVYADQNFMTDGDRQRGPGLVRCNTASAADYKHPIQRPRRVRDVTQSTPNFHHPRRFDKPQPDIPEENPKVSEPQVTDVKRNKGENKSKDNLKSRRYSSGDLYLSKLRQTINLSCLKKGSGFGASAAVLHHHSVVVHNGHTTLRSQSVVDINEFHANVQKSLAVLAPKLYTGACCGRSVSSSELKDEDPLSNLDNVLRLGAHGSGCTSASSLNLSQVLPSHGGDSDDRLTTATAPVTPTGHNVCLSACDHKAPLNCRISSLSDICLSVSPCSNKQCIKHTSPCKCPKVAHKNSQLSQSAFNITIRTSVHVQEPITQSASLSHLNNCTKSGTSSMMKQDSAIQTLLNGTNNQRPFTGTGTGSTNGSVADERQLSNSQSTPNLNPLNSPLQYVDLSPYDGVDDGYIYSLTNRSDKKRLATTKQQKDSAEYQNIALPNNKPANSSCQSSISSNTTTKVGAIHGSLRRPENHGLIKAYHRELDSLHGHNGGEYVRLKADDAGIVGQPPPRPARRPRGGSVDNLRDKSNQSANYTNLLNMGKQAHPGSLLSTVVPAHLASYSKEDLLEALAKQNGHTTECHRKLSEDYQPMNMGQNRRSTDKPGMIRETDYVIMNGSSGRKKAAEADNSVFCPVELPAKQNASDQWRRASSFTCSSRSNYINSVALNNSSASPEDSYLDMSLGKSSIRHSATEPSYLDMSLPQKGPKSSSSIRSSGSSNYYNMSQSTGHMKPTLLHSKSLDNELDGPYLDMNSVNQRRNSAEYLVMNQGRASSAAAHNSQEQDNNIYANTGPVKPFDNLIQHKCYSKAKDYVQVSSSSVSTGSTGRPTDNTSSNGDKSSSDDDNNSQKSSKSNKSTPSKKAPSLLSRLMKRSSLRVKDKSKLKQSRSTQEFSSLDSSVSSASDRRLSMQNPPSAKFTIGTRLSESDSASNSSSNMASSTPSGSPNDSGLVSLSQWRLGTGSSPSHRPLTSQDLCGPNVHVPAPRPASNNGTNTHPYINDIVGWATPPVLPPKSYNKNKGSSKMVIHIPPSTSQPSPRRPSKEDEPSPDSEDAYLDMSLGTKSKSTVPPPLPEKKGTASKNKLATVDENSGECISDNTRSGTDDDDVFLEDSKSVLPSSVRPRKKPNLTLTLEETSSECSRHQQTGRSTAASEVWHDARDVNGSPCVPCRRPVSASSLLTPSSVEERHAHHRLRSTSTRSTASDSSCDSYCEDGHSNYHSHHHHHHVSSPGITTMRPRFGKEYKRIDRKKLAEQLNMPLPGATPSLSPSAEPSPSVASTVFNFEFPAISKSRQDSTCSVGDVAMASSPKYPASLPGSQGSTTSHRHREPAYVNLSFSRTSSPVILESTPPPQSPGARSNMSDNSDMLLNYAEIDLTDSGKGKKSSARPVPKKGTVDYAVIDMVATAAISRVGREQAQLREDKLLRDSMSRYGSSAGSTGSSHSDKHHSGSVTLPTPGREKRNALGRSNSTSSRDRKL